jgi:DNA-binding transcriptional ArsR family regulator
MPTTDRDQELDLTFHALADPTRRAILARLAKGEATVNELAEPFDISLPAISRHLKVLEKAGLISRGKDAQFRPCRLEPEGLRDVHAWIDAYKEHWEQRFDRLAAYLTQIQKPRDEDPEP